MSEPLDPTIETRLTSSLDAVQPRTPDPAGARYAALPSGARMPLLRPAVAGLAAAALIAMTAVAATGSANPAVWTQRAVDGMQGAGHSTGRPSPNPVDSGHHGPGVGGSPTSGRESPKPAPSEGEKESAGPDQGPGGGDAGGDGEHATPGTSPSPTPDHDGDGGDGGGDHSGPGSGASPSPTPDGESASGGSGSGPEGD